MTIDNVSLSLPLLTVLLTEFSIGIYTIFPLAIILLTDSRTKIIRR